MSGFLFSEGKALAVVLFVLKELGGKVDKYKLARILYCADKKHLSEYARLVTGDQYIAMPVGPIPAGIYEEIEKGTLNSKGNIVISDQDPDMKLLSKTDVECLSQSIVENKDLLLGDIENKSNQEICNKTYGDPISVSDMAKEAGASDELIKYIAELLADYQSI